MVRLVLISTVVAACACEVSRPSLPRPALASSPTARVASKGAVGLEYTEALHVCARDNLEIDGKKLPDGVAAVGFVVRGGRFVDPHLVRASGSPDFDRAVLAAVKACDARIATPAELREQLASEGIEVSFHGKNESYVRHSTRQPTVVVREP